MNKRQLKRVLRESIQNVLSEGMSHPEKGACPEIYDWEKLISVAQSMLMGRYRSYSEPPTGFMKAWNRYAKRGMNIPPILYDSVPECARVVMRLGSKSWNLSDEGFHEICDAWMIDASELDDHSWNYDPDGW